MNQTSLNLANKLNNYNRTMKKRKIRSLSVSEIGMGCMGFSHGYGQIPAAGYAEEDYPMSA